MEYTPEASRLVLLSQLSRITAGTKVRFLGCVEAYNGELGILKIKERFPATSSHTKTVNVNVDNILDSLNLELTQVGAWVNVVGYCGRSGEAGVTSEDLNVDAVLVWSAGAIKLDEYEAAVRALQSST